MVHTLASFFDLFLCFWNVIYRKKNRTILRDLNSDCFNHKESILTAKLATTTAHPPTYSILLSQHLLFELDTTIGCLQYEGVFCFYDFFVCVRCREGSEVESMELFSVRRWTTGLAQQSNMCGMLPCMYCIICWVWHKHNSLPLGPIKPSSPFSKELDGGCSKWTDEESFDVCVRQTQKRIKLACKQIGREIGVFVGVCVCVREREREREREELVN